MNEIVFDHTKNAAIIQKDKICYLLQDGELFSYAEYDKVGKVWKPEPYHISEQEYVTKIMFEVEGMLKEEKKILDKLMATNIKAIEAFSLDAIKARKKLTQTVHSLTMENTHLKKKLAKLEGYAEISEMEEKIEETKGKIKKKGNGK